MIWGVGAQDIPSAKVFKKSREISHVIGQGLFMGGPAFADKQGKHLVRRGDRQGFVAGVK